MEADFNPAANPLIPDSTDSSPSSRCYGEDFHIRDSLANSQVF